MRATTSRSTARARTGWTCRGCRADRTVPRPRAGRGWPGAGAGGVITIIQAASWRRMTWKKGQGEMTEIAVEPGPGTGFLWRFSIADVGQPGPFFRYTVVTRWITVLDDAGMRLTVGADALRFLSTRHPP